MAKSNSSTLSGRKRVALYARHRLGVLEASSFGNKQLCMIVGIWPMNHPLSQKRAFELVQEFAFSDPVNAVIEEQTSKRKKRKVAANASGEFYRTREWLDLRYRVLKAANGKCECCGASSNDGVSLHVDHIKPRSLYPELALEFSNMQVLCEQCNMGKSNKDETDWRFSEYSDSQIGALLRSF